MRRHIDSIMKETLFPDEAHDFFLKLYDKLTESEIEEISAWQRVYFTDKKTRAQCDEINIEVCEALKEFAACRGYDYRCIHMLFLLFCTKELRVKYAQKGLSDELYIALMKDLCYKVIECKKYCGIWGSLVFTWFHRHFLVDRFALGRFQFEESGFLNDSYDFEDVHLKKGDRVINIHIPSSGPMTDEMRIESYKKAYEFFKKPDEKYVVFVCNSWLLYPENENIYPKSSNMYKFLKEFDIISSFTHPVFPFRDAWRVFNVDYTGDTSVLPRNTALEKNIAAWLDAGKKIGSGYGVMIFDGDKMINIK